MPSAREEDQINWEHNQLNIILLHCCIKIIKIHKKELFSNRYATESIASGAWTNGNLICILFVFSLRSSDLSRYQVQSIN